ncbi:hypothetical protein BJV82DRAFT_95672 [Fennellomyces sp. T-0311]|nr:hypothetical protein BJV82DRAFT_95672 [Fennellomyces sp. T-0311]
MRPPPLDTSFMHNGSHMQQYPNINTGYPTPALTSRPQSMYQTPPSSGGSNSSNPQDQRARRISVATGDNGWKVSGRSSGAPSQHQPNGYEHPGSSFNDRRMRRQSMGSAVGEHPITPAYTPRDSQYGYFSPTHATMSPQEHVAPAMPQPISKRESFVGGFVIPPAYPPYRPAQAPQETPYQYPQTPHHHSAPQYPQTPHHQPVSQPLYPQTPHQQSAPQAPYPQTQHHQPAPQHRTSYYAHNDSYYHGNYAVTTAAAGDVPPSSATAEYFPAAAAAAAASSDNPPAGRARSVKSVRSVRSNKSLNGTSGETKQVPRNANF